MGFVYLDNHATTRCDPRVVEAMLPWLTSRYGNASSTQYALGRAAAEAVELARGQIASLVGASPRDVVFTSGATEALNLALFGLSAGRSKRKHLVVLETEHAAVLDCANQLERDGWRITRLVVGRDGLLDLPTLEAALTPETALVAVMLANNEIGVLQPIREVADLCHARDVLLVCDAVQAVGHIPVDMKALGCDAAAISAHKLYGPKGIGALIVRRRPPLALRPLLFGGGHERGRRSGTLAVPLIVGFGRACEIAAQELEREGERLAKLRDRLLEGLREGIEGLVVNGALSPRLPHNLNVSIPCVQADALMRDLGDVALSSGAACSTATLSPSHVLKALGCSDENAYGALRMGLGRFTTDDDIAFAVARICQAVAKVRAQNPLWASRQAQRVEELASSGSV